MNIVIRAAVLAAASLAGASAFAQQSPPQFPDMTFFVTSKPGPAGADFGGLEGADKFCQSLAANAGAGGKTWHAYLSQQAIGGASAVNARDRIGAGPWRNAKGEVIAASVAELHGANRLGLDTSLTETGRRVPGVGFINTVHDILTGSTPDGTAPAPDKDMTCGNWTKNGEGTAIVGHSDRLGLRDDAPAHSWNSSHPTRGCNAPAFTSTGGAGYLYCFATN